MSVKNRRLHTWVSQIAQLCKPDDIHWCDGSQAEYDMLSAKMVKHGTYVKLNEHLRPNSYLCRSNPDDVARSEARTFICSRKEIDAGPTNNWCDPDKMKHKLRGFFNGCMRGRTLFVIPFSMGPIGSDISHIGVEITDSLYVVCNMRIMTRMGKDVLSALGNNDFVHCLHSVGAPLTPGQKDAPWPCNPENKYIVHFPEERAIWSFGSGYGGNALLGKKCFALRIASAIAHDEGWLAEHMLILSLTPPKGERIYIAAAFPSACGKTNLAMMNSTIPGWKIQCLGDDIAWMKLGDDGRLYAINPENGFFGVAPGTSMKSNPNALRTLTKNCIFTNAALTPEHDIWWEGLTEKPPSKLESWLGEDWTPDCGKKAAHPNARFTAPIAECPICDPRWNDPDGVPISAIIFGGRRPTTIPLVFEAFGWQHGIFLGSIQSSETTAANAAAVGIVRRDPMAMLPFCGYNIGDYFQHWLNMSKKNNCRLPKIFYVNWFRKGNDGKWLWPGFGENSRILKWMYECIQGIGKAKKTPIGFTPTIDAIDTKGLSISRENIKVLLEIDREGWLNEVKDIQKHYQKLGERLPVELKDELAKMQKRLLEPE